MSSVARKIFSTRPNPSSTPAAARSIVATLRDAGPLSWKELWTASAGADLVLPKEEELAAQRAKKKREDGHLRLSELGYVREGHPFQSVTYFKQHILKNLEQQGFIEKVAIAHSPAASASDAASSSSSSSATLAAIRRESVLQKQLRKSSRAQGKAPEQASDAASGKTVQEFVWALPRALTAPSADLDADPLLAAERDRLEDRLERLYLARNNHDLVRLARDQRAVDASRAQDGRERAIGAGKIQRTQDEMMAWPFRQEFLTTEKERIYLNKRRGLARPAKERRAQSWWDGAQEARQEARQA